MSFLFCGASLFCGGPSPKTEAALSFPDPWRGAGARPPGPELLRVTPQTDRGSFEARGSFRRNVPQLGRPGFMEQEGSLFCMSWGPERPHKHKDPTGPRQGDSRNHDFQDPCVHVFVRPSWFTDHELQRSSSFRAETPRLFFSLTARLEHEPTRSQLPL